MGTCCLWSVSKSIPAKKGWVFNARKPPPSYTTGSFSATAEADERDDELDEEAEEEELVAGDVADCESEADAWSRLPKGAGAKESSIWEQ